MDVMENYLEDKLRSKSNLFPGSWYLTLKIKVTEVDHLLFLSNLTDKRSMIHSLLNKLDKQTTNKTLSYKQFRQDK